MFHPGEHEELFDVQPVGVRYICEFCHKGEMKVVSEIPVPFGESPLIQHKCTSCGKIMQLPKAYPYIEWIPEDGSN